MSRAQDKTLEFYVEKIDNGFIVERFLPDHVLGEDAGKKFCSDKAAVVEELHNAFSDWEKEND